MSPKRQARLLNRAYLLHRSGEIGQALLLYRQVLEANPGHPVAWHQAALAARQLADLAIANGIPYDRDQSRRLMEGAIAAAGRVFERMADGPVDPGLAKDCAGIIHNYAKFLNDHGAFEDRAAVIQCYEVAVSLCPDLGESWTNLGVAYGDSGNRMRAEACWARALECPTPTPESRFNLSLLHLLRGDYETGWREYEGRWESVTFQSSYGRPDLTAPRWDGGHVDTLLLHGEQGAGDILMMARYIPLAQARCHRLVVEVVDSLLTLMRETFPDVLIVGRGEYPEHDAQCPMMSLPLVFGTTLTNVPQPVPFRVKAA